MSTNTEFNIKEVTRITDETQRKEIEDRIESLEETVRELSRPYEEEMARLRAKLTGIPPRIQECIDDWREEGDFCPESADLLWERLEKFLPAGRYFDEIQGFIEDEDFSEYSREELEYTMRLVENIRADIQACCGDWDWRWRHNCWDD